MKATRSGNSDRNPVLKWQLLPDDDIFLYGRSFRNMAATTMRAVDLDASPFASFDACGIVFMYRHAVEIQLKALVLGDGANFLAAKPDPLSVYKTHSLSWLAQFVAQIVTTVGWEEEFKAEGIETLAEFKAAVDEINDSGPAPYGFRIPVSPEGQEFDPATLAATIREIVSRIEALLDLLERTADALAAEWDLRSDGNGDDSDLSDSGGKVPPTIH